MAYMTVGELDEIAKVQGLGWTPRWERKKKAKKKSSRKKGARRRRRPAARGVSISPGILTKEATAAVVPIGVSVVEMKRRSRRARTRSRSIASQIARLDAIIARYTKHREALLAQQAKVTAEEAAEAIVSDLMGW